jgi:hypothetical protein
MHAKDFVVNYSGYRQKIEYFGKGTPNIQRSIFFYAFIVETVDLSDESRLMVASEKSYSVFIAYF